MKSYTNLEQSKKLTEILPIESADMIWKKELKYRIYSDEYEVSESDFIYHPTFKEEKIIMLNFDVPCWSLTALLNVIPYSSLHKTYSGWRCDSYNKDGTSCLLGVNASTSVGAAYKTILELHEQKLL